MWVKRGGPPGKQSVLFEYDLSRAGAVLVRLLNDFTGILQTDGYSGYNKVCRDNGIARIGCRDHARRKFIEATKAAPTGAKKKTTASKANVALSYISILYAIDRDIWEKSEADKCQARHAQSVSLFIVFKL